MRISELASRAGVPLPTVKYYLREGLLMPGRVTSATQAQYDDRHVRRLGLVRALAAQGLPLDRINTIVASRTIPETTCSRRSARRSPRCRPTSTKNPGTPAALPV